MSSEHNDSPLFRKLTDPKEIYEACVRGGDYMTDIIYAWGWDGEFPMYADISRLSEDPPRPDPMDDVAWLFRESKRASQQWRQLSDFDLWALSVACEPKEPRKFYRWALAPSVSDRTKIRYTPSAEYGKADRQIVTTLGKFLTKHYKDVLSAEQIRHWANQWSAHTQPVELKFADTADEVEHVYVNGPQSCMSGSGDFHSDEHPARLWGYCKHTRVAYAERNGKIVARTVVREDVEPKIYVRIYPDYQTAFEEALQAAGYKHDFEGLEGLVVPAMRDGRGYLMPYVDGISTASEVSGGLRLGCGPLSTHQTNGRTCEEEDDSWQCPECGAWHDSNEAEIYSDFTDTSFCSSCDENWVYARTHCGESHVRVDDAAEYKRRWYSTDRRTLAHYDLVMLDDNLYSTEDLVTLEDGDLCHMDDAVCTPWDTYLLASVAIEDDYGNHTTLERLYLIDEGEVTTMAAFDPNEDNPDFEQEKLEGRLLSPAQWFAAHAALTWEQKCARLKDKTRACVELLAELLAEVKKEQERAGQISLAA